MPETHRTLESSVGQGFFQLSLPPKSSAGVYLAHFCQIYLVSFKNPFGIHVTGIFTDIYHTKSSQMSGKSTSPMDFYGNPSFFHPSLGFPWADLRCHFVSKKGPRVATNSWQKPWQEHGSQPGD